MSARKLHADDSWATQKQLSSNMWVTRMLDMRVHTSGLQVKDDQQDEMLHSRMWSEWKL